MDRFRILVIGLLGSSLSLAAWCAAQSPTDGGPPRTAKKAKPKDERDLDAPYVSTPQDVVDKMLTLAGVKKDDVVYDLGCGDGRIVVAAAKRFSCKAVGIDLDPRRVKEAKQNARIARVDHLVTIRKQDLFTVDLSECDVLAIYLFPELNAKLVPQIAKMKPGSRIVSHAYTIPGFKPKRTVRVRSEDGVERVLYLWETPLRK